MPISANDIKFANLPMDVDTEIHLQSVVHLSRFSAVIQTWDWNGIVGTSAIIPENDIVGLSDDEVLDLLRREKLEVQPPYTIVRDRNGFCFVNFEFITT
jgi:hypothetical protein